MPEHNGRHYAEYALAVQHQHGCALFELGAVSGTYFPLPSPFSDDASLYDSETESNSFEEPHEFRRDWDEEPENYGGELWSGSGLAWDVRGFERLLLPEHNFLRARSELQGKPSKF